MSNIPLIIGLVLFAAVTLTGAILAQSDWRQYAAASRETLDMDSVSKSPADAARTGPRRVTETDAI